MVIVAVCFLQVACKFLGVFFIFSSVIGEQFNLGLCMQ